MESKNIGYLPAIDHLRAFAALLIVYFHGLQFFTYAERFHQPFSYDHWLQSPLWYLAMLLEGHTAVALFMVLSGFIFTHGSLGKEVIYSRFIANRLLRTYPLFILLVFVGISAFPGALEPLPLLQTVFGFANNGNALQLRSFSAMFWGISIEWHFYLVFPFLLLFLHRYGVKYLLGVMALFAIFRLMAFYHGASMRNLGYLTIIGRMDQFVLGMLAAVAYARMRVSRPAATTILVAALGGLTLLLYDMNLGGGWPMENPFRIVFHTIEGFLWALVIYGYLIVAPTARGAISRVFGYVGTISYSIYLIHFTIIILLIKTGVYWRPTDSQIANAMLTTTAIVLPITFVVSILTYYCVELPFLSMRVKYHRD